VAEFWLADWLLDIAAGWEFEFCVELSCARTGNASVAHNSNPRRVRFFICSSSSKSVLRSARLTKALLIAPLKNWYYDLAGAGGRDRCISKRKFDATC
jgi:hypothetical protein